MVDSDLDVRPAGEQAVLDEVRIDDGWQLLQEFSHLVRELGLRGRGALGGAHHLAPGCLGHPLPGA